MTAATSPRWTSQCTGCRREDVGVESRRTHGERVLCDACAARPYTLAAGGLDPPAPPRNGSRRAAAASTGRRVELTPASAIQSERVRWIWTSRIPRRSLVVVCGEKGLGKSLLTNSLLAAELTRGTLDGELHGTPADVLVATAEDDWRSVVKPRLMAHGADLQRVHRVATRDTDDSEALLTLPTDVALLEKRVKALRDAGRTAALVIDPIGAFLAEGTDTHRDASVRRALAPLAAMAERLDLAVIVVAHLTKDESSRLINRVSGAGAFVNAARSVLAFARDPSDPAGEQGTERVLAHVASNWGTYAPTLAYRVEGRQIDVDDGSIADVGYLVAKGATDVGVDDLQRGPDENGTDAQEAIGAALADGARPSRIVKAEVVTALGCSKRTVERAAVRMADAGELRIEQGGFPRTTTWALISRDTPDHSRDTTPDAVATNPNTRSVATDSSDVFTGDSALSSDSGDSPQTDVVTAEDPDVERAELLAARHHDLQESA